MQYFNVTMRVVALFAIALYFCNVNADSSQDAIQQICRQPRIVGQCETAQKRWGYDPQSGQCQEFVYNGCMGNLNNFLKKEHCEKLCQGVQPCKGLEIMPYGCVVTELDDGPNGCPDFKIDCSSYPRRVQSYQKIEEATTNLSIAEGDAGQSDNASQ